MTTFTEPPRSTAYEIREGKTPSLSAWAVQRFLNALNAEVKRYPHLTEDGVFGKLTVQAVQAYQGDVDIAQDGVVGAATQARIARSCRFRADKEGITPTGLIDSLVAGESGGMLGAVNWSVPGGVDCGVTQRRVYTPFTDAALKRAFDCLYQTNLLVDQFISRYAAYFEYPAVKARSDRHEYAWRLAALEHNWPYGAQTLAAGRALSATRRASWIPMGTRFEDGTQVVSFADWAKFYAMGSKLHRHHGLVVRKAFGGPTSG
jgi:hypothetical protein